jgi:thioredoxin-related protein
MYKFFITTLFFVLFLSFQTSKAEVILVNGGYKETLSLAEIENKKIFLLFVSDTCHWCDSQKKVLLKDSVLDSLENYIILQVDSERNPEIARKYRVRSIPTSFIIDSKEKIYKKNVGYLSEEKLINWIK